MRNIKFFASLMRLIAVLSLLPCYVCAQDSRISALKSDIKLENAGRANYSELLSVLQASPNPGKAKNLIGKTIVFEGFFRSIQDGRLSIRTQAGLDAYVMLDRNEKFSPTGDSMTLWIMGIIESIPQVLNPETISFSVRDAKIKAIAVN